MCLTARQLKPFVYRLLLQLSPISLTHRQGSRTVVSPRTIYFHVILWPMLALTVLAGIALFGVVTLFHFFIAIAFVRHLHAELEQVSTTCVYEEGCACDTFNQPCFMSRRQVFDPSAAAAAAPAPAGSRRRSTRKPSRVVAQGLSSVAEQG